MGGRKMTDEQRAARGEAWKRRYRDNPELREQRRQQMVAQWRDPETRARMMARQAQAEGVGRPKGYRASDNTRKKLSLIASVLGADPEMKRRRSEIMRQRWQDPAFRARMTGPRGRADTQGRDEQ